jgi:hypothetical protein
MTGPDEPVLVAGSAGATGEAMMRHHEQVQDAAPSHARSGAEWAILLARRHAGQDWIAAVAKGVGANRAEIEGHFRSAEPLPPDVRAAVDQLAALLAPPDPSARDDVFASSTNSDAAPIEVDAEPGVTISNPVKPTPSRSGSPHEMGVKREVD